MEKETFFWETFLDDLQNRGCKSRRQKKKKKRGKVGNVLSLFEQMKNGPKLNFFFFEIRKRENQEANNEKETKGMRKKSCS